MSELFGDMPESLSPREAWVRRNGVRLETTDDKDGNPLWFAKIPGHSAQGATREDAIWRLATYLEATQDIPHFANGG